MQEQEAELRQHVLHSPQPHRVSRSPVMAAYDPAPTVPLYDHTSQYGMPPGYSYPPPVNPVMTHQSMFMTHAPPPRADFDLSKTTLAGYELIASKLTSKKGAEDDDPPLSPMYRKFEMLNHRILLHLQDEIAELEEELRLVDERIAQVTPRAEKDKLQPAARRAETEFGGEYFRRTELLGRIFVKLGQYSMSVLPQLVSSLLTLAI